MCNWKKWIWPGILTCAILSFLALYMKSDVIEADLGAKATAALAGSGQPWAKVEMDGRDATVSGVAPSESAQSEAAATALNAYDVRVVSNKTELMAAQSPYVLTAKRDGTAIELTGFVPSDAVRETVVASAKEAISGASIDDKMTLARGAPEGLAAMAGFGLTQLSGLSKGEMSLKDTDLSVVGAASDRAQYNGVNAALDGALPGGAKLAKKDITAPVASPYTWSAEYSGEKVTLGGFVPSADAAKSVAEAAKAALPNAEIIDNQLVASGAPDGFGDATAYALQQLPRFTSGKVGLSDLDLSVTGVANSSGNYTTALGAIGAASLPAGIALANADISPATISPYTWGADYDGAKVALNGFVPDNSSRDAVISKAKQELPSAEIVDNMQIAAGAPEGFASDRDFAIEQLPRFSSGSVGLSDRNLTVKGVAKDAGLYSSATAAVGALPAGMALAGADISPSTVSPYTWAADYDGSKVVLSGFVPDNSTRDALVNKAKEELPSAEVEDNMQIAAGAPEGFAGDANFAIQQLPRFSSGAVGLSNRDLTVNGVAKDVGLYSAATAAVGALPAGMVLANSKISPSTVSPYIWSADYDGESVKLSGFVPDSDTRTAIVAATNKALPSVTVSDEMQIAAGAPAQFTQAASFGAGQLRRFSMGSASLSDLALSVKGTGKDSANYTVAKAVANGALPAGLALASEEIVPPTVSPYTWAADYNGKDVVLSGLVPGDDERAAINAAAKEALPAAKIIDEMKTAAGAPDDFVNAIGFSTNQLTRFSSGNVALSESALDIRGVALTSADYEAAKTAVSNDLPAGMTLASENIVPPTVSPYTWEAQSNGSKVWLTGFVPDDAARTAVLGSVKSVLPNAEVDDKMQIAAGAPTGFVGATDYAVSQLPKFSSGSVGLSDLDYTVRGVATDTQNYLDAKSAANGDLPEGMKLSAEKIVPPTFDPYTWSAKYDGKTVVLDGYVPDDATRESIVAETESKLPAAKVVDQMQIAAGAPTTFSDATSGAIKVLPRFSSGDVALSNLDLTVNGVGKTSANYLAADRYVAGNLAGDARLAAASIAPPVQQGDYVWSARKAGNNIVLSGLAPSKQDRSRIATRTGVLNPGTTVINRMTVERGAPKGFIPNTNKGLSLLDGLTEGTASIKNEQLSIVGVAKTVNSYEVAQNSIAGDLNAGYAWDVRDIKPPVISPFSWSIDKGIDKAVLGGFVPNRGLGNTNVSATKAVLNKPVDDRQRVAGGAPDGFGNAAASLIAGVNRLDNSRGTITGTNVFVQGRATSEAEATRIGDEIGQSLPENYKYRKQISYPLPKPEPKPAPKPAPAVVEAKPEPEPEPKVCTVDFASIFAGEKILFDTARAVIKTDSYPLLNKLANGLKECENSIVEIGGHTDSRGSGSYNQGLSEARARAVVDYMTTQAGVKGESLVAKGYGEVQPIASNNLPQDRAKNRRIEFKILKQN